MTQEAFERVLAGEIPAKRWLNVEVQEALALAQDLRVLPTLRIHALALAVADDDGAAHFAAGELAKIVPGYDQTTQTVATFTAEQIRYLVHAGIRVGLFDPSSTDTRIVLSRELHRKHEDSEAA